MTNDKTSLRGSVIEQWVRENTAEATVPKLTQEKSFTSLVETEDNAMVTVGKRTYFGTKETYKTIYPDSGLVGIHHVLYPEMVRASMRNKYRPHEGTKQRTGKAA